MAEEHIDAFRGVLDAVARERRYLLFLEAPPLEDVRAFVRRGIANGHAHCIALAGGKVVGWCDILPDVRQAAAHVGVLGMGVLERFRGRGIGGALAKAALERARAKGLTRVELTVREDNPRAIGLYEKLGFAREGLKRNAVRVDARYENLICMALMLE